MFTTWHLSWYTNDDRRYEDTNGPSPDTLTTMTSPLLCLCAELLFVGLSFSISNHNWFSGMNRPILHFVYLFLARYVPNVAKRSI